MIQNGLYKASFKTPDDYGNGVIYLHDGNAYGGDANYYYKAKYSVNGSQMVATFEMNEHTQGGESVFGADKLSLEIAGTYNSNSALLSANSPAGRFEVSLTLLVPAKGLVPAG